jgi:hypothetical protein
MKVLRWRGRDNHKHICVALGLAADKLHHKIFPRLGAQLPILGQPKLLPEHIHHF